jgi:hypothetical protein
MTKQNQPAEKAPESVTEIKNYSREDVQSILDNVASKIVESNTPYMHSMLLLDHLLRSPNAHEIFDKDLKDQARDLWLKVKSTGLQLSDPPFLFEQSGKDGVGA